MVVLRMLTNKQIFLLICLFFCLFLLPKHDTISMVNIDRGIKIFMIEEKENI